MPSSNSNCSSFFLLLLVALLMTVFGAAQLDAHFDEAQVYWPSQIKRSTEFALPGLRGLRGKRDPIYQMMYEKRVPMMSLKGLRGKRFYYGDDQ